MVATQWTIRNTFLELAEPVGARCRASSDFNVEYSTECLMSAQCKMNGIIEKTCDNSTSAGSWADESDEEREKIITSVDLTDDEEMTIDLTDVPMPTNNMMQCSWMPCMLPMSTAWTPPPSPTRPSEAPILPKPVKTQCVNLDQTQTTVMIRNMPNNYTRTMVLELLDQHGFTGQYDFVYLPIDFETKACLGYAFINMVDREAADSFWSVFNGFSSWSIPSRKVAGVSWSGPHQGLEAHIERYRNSSIMTVGTPDDYKPIILSNGVRTSFPSPTRKLRMSRQSGRR